MLISKLSLAYHWIILVVSIKFSTKSILGNFENIYKSNSNIWNHNCKALPQPTITCSKLIIKTLERCEICSKLTIKTQWRRSGVFIVNLENISHFALGFLLLTLGSQMPGGTLFKRIWRYCYLYFGTGFMYPLESWTDCAVLG